jgi:hypothetical protein
MFDKFISKYMKTTTDPAANVQEQLSQIEQTSGGVEGTKKKYGVAFKKGGSVKKELKKIAQVVKQGPKPKVNTKEISSDFKDFGVGVDPFDNKFFLYGAKKIGENIFATGGVKGEKDFYANVQKGNFNIGLDKQGSNKRITFGFEKKFNEGGLVSRGQGKARKKNFKIY